MSRVKLTTDNYCHKPIKGGDRVEALIDAAAGSRLDEYLASGNSINVVADRGMSALHALARKGSGTKRDRIALGALVEAGIDLDMLNFRKESALFRAFVTESMWMVVPLLEAGASLDVVNNQGVSLRSLGEKFEVFQVFSQAIDLEMAVPRPTKSSMRRSI